MNNQTILIAIITLLIGGIGGYFIANQSDRGYMMHGDEHMGAQSSLDGMHRMPDGSMMGNDSAGMGHMMDMMVESEREFIEGMIPHHQEAIDTAREVLVRGGSTPEMQELAENIIVAQEAEIAAMKAWYRDWYGVEYADNGEYMPMMRELENLSGAELDRVFLEDMIGHHMGAIMMARSVQPYIEHDEMAELAQNIVSTQSAEIAQMRLLLREI